MVVAHFKYFLIINFCKWKYCRFALYTNPIFHESTINFVCLGYLDTRHMEREFTYTAGYFGFVKNSGITFFAVFVYTFPAAPLGSRVFALEFVFSIVQVRAVRMVPIRASVAEDSILAIYWENFVTAYAVLVNTRITSPGFIGFFLCNLITWFSKLVQFQ